MRRAARVDANQSAIIGAFEACGATVYVIGKPVDLVVGHQGRNWLVEVKDGDKKAYERPLTAAQVEFIRDWRGQVAVVTCVEEAIALLASKPASLLRETAAALQP